MRRASLLCALACCAGLAGCVMFEVGVTNPISGLTTVAVAPFFNLSQERAVDGRRFAMAYYTELQKTPGFQVIPVGVVEQAIYDHRLEVENPDDVLKLAQILGVDAVVVGAVTDYSPYYPPRIGLQVSWYSPRPWTFYPGVPTDEFARKLAMPKKSWRLGRKDECVECPSGTSCPPAAATTISRGQSPDAVETGAAVRERSGWWPWPSAGDAKPAQSASAPAVPVDAFGSTPKLAEPFDPRQPLMSYTRMFDGADPKLTARLRDYVELQGDLRSGGWESYLERSEDFIRFTSHLMVVEMLQLHGGEAKRRMVVKLRKYR